MYAHCLKRLFDFLIALCAILVLSPLLVLLTVIGAVAMRGNPFFVQHRPGKHERIFRMIKFRTMTNRRDGSGELLPDAQRLNGYGRFLRRTSLDELPELFNILMGQMAIVGPRPLLVRYLPRYSEAQRHRHDVRPGLTGYAQVHGRNALSWEERFEMDLHYVRHITLWGDIKILFGTVGAVFKGKGVTADTSEIMEEFTGSAAQIANEEQRSLK